MITPRAKQGIEQLFIRSAKRNLVIHEGDRCDVVRTPEDCLGKRSADSILIFTICSFPFRLLTVFYVNETASVSSYLGVDATGGKFVDAFAEYANLCCGAINRALSEYFPHLGMSTPYTLSSECVPFLDEMEPALLSDYTISINDSVQLRTMLCMMTYGAIDFAIEETALEESTGDLQLF